jgi:hypothetical protein
MGDTCGFQSKRAHLSGKKARICEETEKNHVIDELQRSENAGIHDFYLSIRKKRGGALLWIYETPL